MKTTKSKVLASLLFAGALITSTSVFADEAQPTTTDTTTPVVDTNAPTDFTLENGSNSGSVTPSVDTTDNSTTEKPKVDTTVGNITTEKPTLDPVANNTTGKDSTVDTSSSNKPGTVDTSGNTSHGTVDTSSTDKDKTADPESDSKAQSANSESLKTSETVSPSVTPTTPANSENSTTPTTKNEDKPAVGEISKETQQVVSPVSETQPVVTDTGFKIVATANSNLVVQDFDGTLTQVSAEEVGGKVNKDGTVSVKTSEGKMTTLPETGEATTMMTTIGFLVLAFLGLYQGRANANDNWF